MINRRDFLKSSLLLTGYSLLGRRLVYADTIKDDAVRAVSLNITYVTEILKPPKKRGVNIWIPLPCSDTEQEISGLSIETSLPYRVTETKSSGDRMLFLGRDTLKKGERITVRFQLTRKASGIIEDGKEPQEMDSRPSEWEKWDDNIAAFVDSLVAKESDPVEIGRRIYYAVIERLRYIHEVCGRGVSILTFEDRLGRCDEYHALFRSMMMYKGLPVRWEQGVALPYPSELKKKGEFEADCINAHSWARFYIGNGRWFPVDVSEGDRRPDLRDYYYGSLVPNRIKLSTGRGLVLNPPQKGIINTFAYTYIEAGGIPAIYGHNYRNKIRYELVGIER
jgi:transglutaminase-like putative cysteine protease